MENTGKIFDGLLVLQYQAGNKKALTLLVNRYHIKLCRHSYRYTHDTDSSKDIVQDCWSVIANKLGNLREPNSFGSWAIKIVTRKSLDFLTREKRKREKLLEYYYVSDVREDNLEKESDVRMLLKAMKELPNNQQLVLRLFYLNEYALKEISEMLKISGGTVKSRLFHAREKLKLILKNSKDEK